MIPCCAVYNVSKEEQRVQVFVCVCVCVCVWVNGILCGVLGPRTEDITRDEKIAV